jgi:hypothetical protein
MNKLYLALAISLIGCGSDEPSGPEVLDELPLPDKPDNGIQVITPIFEGIQPGTDNEVCVWTDVIFDKETDVRSSISYQNEPPGHHAILFYTLDKQPAGTQRICTDTDMASFRYLTGNAGNQVLNEAPEGLVFRIPKGAQVVVNAHYLNTSDEVVRGQSVVNVNFAPPGEYITSSNTAIVNTGLEVEMGVSSQKMHCEFEKELKLWYFIPHMHRWGTHINVDVTRSGVKERIWDLDWQDQYTFHPPEKRFGTDAPFVFKPGDAIDIECTWNNTEGRVLPFGFEMCVAFGQYIDTAKQGNWACNGGEWTVF